MSEEKIVIRGFLRYYWKKGLSAKAAAEKICAIKKELIIHRNTAAQPRSGRQSVVDDDVLLQPTCNYSWFIGRSRDSNLYCEQLDIVYAVSSAKYPILVKRNQAILQHDNDSALRSRLIKEKLSEMQEVWFCFILRIARIMRHQIMICVDQWLIF